MQSWNPLLYWEVKMMVEPSGDQSGSVTVEEAPMVPMRRIFPPKAGMV